MQSRRKISSFKNRKGGITIRGNKKRTPGRNELVTAVVRNPMRDHAVITDRMETKVSASYQGYIALGTAGNIFDIYGNSFFEPFNASSPISGVVTGVNSSSSTVNPMGYTALTALYNQYRVKASRMKITFLPLNPGDSVTATVWPSYGVVSDGVPVKAMNQRYAKWKLCSLYNNVKENTIINYIASHKAIGMTKQQYDDQPGTNVGNAPVANTDWYWQCSFYTNSGAVSTQSILVTVELDYYVELFDPVQFQS